MAERHSRPAGRGTHLPTHLLGGGLGGRDNDLALGLGGGDLDRGRAGGAAGGGGALGPAEAGMLMPLERTEPATAETAATPTRGMPASTSMMGLPEVATMPASAASAAAAAP